MSRDSAVRCCATVVTAHTATTAKTAVTITCHLLMSLLQRFLIAGFASGVKVGLKVRLETSGPPEGGPHRRFRPDAVWRLASTHYPSASGKDHRWGPALAGPSGGPC